jgi:hypothetical protein
MIIKPTANLIAVTTDNSVANSTLIRIHTTSATTITVKTSTGNFVGTFSMPANSVEIVEKAALDTIASSESANCTPIAYKS